MMFVLFFLVLPMSVRRADGMSPETSELLGIIRTEEVPIEIREQCKQKVLKRQPLKVTYNWGKLELDYSKTFKELLERCGEEAGGCFDAGSSIRYFDSISEEFIQIGEYRCYYPVNNIDFDFSNFNRHVVVANEYSGCRAQAVLRHELQHFMIWKTGWEQMLIELQDTLLDQSLVFCKNCMDGSTYTDIVPIVNRIYEKWKDIIDRNNARLDEIDHDYKKRVADKMCEVLAISTGLSEF